MPTSTSPVDITTKGFTEMATGSATTSSSTRPCNKWKAEQASLTPEQRAARAVQFVQQRHAVASAGAALLGGAILATRKGTKQHRILGRVWTGVAVLTSLNAFRLRDTHGSFSWFHGLSALTLSSAITGVYCARTKQITRHKKFMGVAYASAVVAGVVAWATPGKTMAWKGPASASLPAQATQA